MQKSNLGPRTVEIHTAEGRKIGEKHDGVAQLFMNPFQKWKTVMISPEIANQIKGCNRLELISPLNSNFDRVSHQNFSLAPPDEMQLWIDLTKNEQYFKPTLTEYGTKVLFPKSTWVTE